MHSLPPPLAPAFPPVHEGHRIAAIAHPRSHLLSLIPSSSKQLDLLRCRPFLFFRDLELAMATFGAKTCEASRTVGCKKTRLGFAGMLQCRSAKVVVQDRFCRVQLRLGRMQGRFGPVAGRVGSESNGPSGSAHDPCGTGSVMEDRGSRWDLGFLTC